MDGSLEQALRRPARAAGNIYAGIVTRAMALAVDALLIVAIFTILSGFVALITSLVGTLRPTWLVGLLLGIGGAIVAGGYLITFWSSVGRTPGMQLAPGSCARAWRRTAVGRTRNRAHVRNLVGDRSALCRLPAGALRRAEARPARLPGRDGGRLRRPDVYPGVGLRLATRHGYCGLGGGSRGGGYFARPSVKIRLNAFVRPERVMGKSPPAPIRETRAPKHRRGARTKARPEACGIGSTAPSRSRAPM